MASNKELEISNYGRPIVWLAQWSWYGGKSRGYCVFGDFRTAVRWAISRSLGSADWEKFPDPARGQFPNADMDGSRPDLNPAFRVTWDKDGGGFAAVERVEVADDIACAGPLTEQVDEIYENILVRRAQRAEARTRVRLGETARIGFDVAPKETTTFYLHSQSHAGKDVEGVQSVTVTVLPAKEAE